MGEIPAQPHQQPQDAPAATADPGRPEAFVTGGVYGMLFVLGVIAAVFWSFMQGWYLGDFPLGAYLSLAVAFLLTWGAGRLMRNRLAAVVTGVSWLFVGMVLSMPRPEGDLVLAGPAQGQSWLLTPGYVYLYGGALVVLIAIMMSKAAPQSWILGGVPGQAGGVPGQAGGVPGQAHHQARD
ncbi:DUF6113 family protein [Bailinhaonella thermotolerans]|uniref:Uncharacterized protein n=1 Tax=Bailinhaonella thermotolerans TaxID=1070861 RepID=A0A3A4B5U8_9ACTN|nr:DUF6113 family protein [Bailinhaonella thermotolerans]RJL33421.1 hypothetical protein D5H75_11570 [Bailinhaonella thermotolerans]